MGILKYGRWASNDDFFMQDFWSSHLSDDNILVKTDEESTKRDIWLTLPSTRTETTLSVRVCSSARIHLYAMIESEPQSYEIIIGAKSNSATQVYIGAAQEGNEPSAEWSSIDVLHCYEYRTFWLSWKNGQIEVAKKSSSGERILEWTHEEPLTVHALSLSTGDGSHGEWKVSREAGEFAEIA